MQMAIKDADGCSQITVSACFFQCFNTLVSVKSDGRLGVVDIKQTQRCEF